MVCVARGCSVVLCVCVCVCVCVKVYIYIRTGEGGWLQLGCGQISHVSKPEPAVTLNFAQQGCICIEIEREGGERERGGERDLRNLISSFQVQCDEVNIAGTLIEEILFSWIF